MTSPGRRREKLAGAYLSSFFMRFGDVELFGHSYSTIALVNPLPNATLRAVSAKTDSRRFALLEPPPSRPVLQGGSLQLHLAFRPTRAGDARATLTVQCLEEVAAPDGRRRSRLVNLTAALFGHGAPSPFEVGPLPTLARPVGASASLDVRVYNPRPFAVVYDPAAHWFTPDPALTVQPRGSVAASELPGHSPRTCAMTQTLGAHARLARLLHPSRAVCVAARVPSVVVVPPASRATVASVSVAVTRPGRTVYTLPVALVDGALGGALAASATPPLAVLGLAPGAVALSPERVGFGAVAPGERVVRAVTLHNQRAGPVTVLAVRALGGGAVGPDASLHVAHPLNARIEAGRSERLLTLTYTGGDEAGDRAGQVEVVYAFGGDGDGAGRGTASVVVRYSAAAVGAVLALHPALESHSGALLVSRGAHGGGVTPCALRNAAAGAVIVYRVRASDAAVALRNAPENVLLAAGALLPAFEVVLPTGRAFDCAGLALLVSTNVSLVRLPLLCQPPPSLLSVELEGAADGGGQGGPAPSSHLDLGFIAAGTSHVRALKLSLGAAGESAALAVHEAWTNVRDLQLSLADAGSGGAAVAATGGGGERCASATAAPAPAVARGGVKRRASMRCRMDDPLAAAAAVRPGAHALAPPRPPPRHVSVLPDTLLPRDAPQRFPLDVELSGRRPVVTLVLELAPTAAVSVAGDVTFNTSHGLFTWPLSFQSEHGSLAFAPRLVSFPPTFPGRVAAAELQAMSTFPHAVRISGLVAADAGVEVVQTASEVPPYGTATIAQLRFDASRMGAASRYMSDALLPGQGRRPVAAGGKAVSAAELEALAERERAWHEMTAAGGNVVRSSVTVRAGAAQGVSVAVKASLMRPTILRSGARSFPLTQVGGHSRASITVINPSDHPILVELLEPLLDVLPRDSLPLAALLQALQLEGAPGGRRPPFAVAAAGGPRLVPPRSEATVGPVFFRPSALGAASALVPIRNNLTLVEVVRVHGVAGSGLLALRPTVGAGEVSAADPAALRAPPSAAACASPLAPSDAAPSGRPEINREARLSAAGVAAPPSSPPPGPPPSVQPAGAPAAAPQWPSAASAAATAASRPSTEPSLVNVTVHVRAPAAGEESGGPACVAEDAVAGGGARDRRGQTWTRLLTASPLPTVRALVAALDGGGACSACSHASIAIVNAGDVTLEVSRVAFLFARGRGPAWLRGPSRWLRGAAPRPGGPFALVGDGGGSDGGVARPFALRPLEERTLTLSYAPLWARRADSAVLVIESAVNEIHVYVTGTAEPSLLRRCQRLRWKACVLLATLAALVALTLGSVVLRLGSARAPVATTLEPTAALVEAPHPTDEDAASPPSASVLAAHARRRRRRRPTASQRPSESGASRPSSVPSSGASTPLLHSPRAGAAADDLCRPPRAVWHAAAPSHLRGAVYGSVPCVDALPAVSSPPPADSVLRSASLPLERHLTCRVSSDEPHQPAGRKGAPGGGGAAGPSNLDADDGLVDGAASPERRLGRHGAHHHFPSMTSLPHMDPFHADAEEEHDAAAAAAAACSPVNGADGLCLRVGSSSTTHSHSLGDAAPAPPAPPLDAAAAAALRTSVCLDLLSSLAGSVSLGPLPPPPDVDWPPCNDDAAEGAAQPPSVFDAGGPRAAERLESVEDASTSDAAPASRGDGLPASASFNSVFDEHPGAEGGGFGRGRLRQSLDDPDARDPVSDLPLRPQLRLRTLSQALVEAEPPGAAQAAFDGGRNEHSMAGGSDDTSELRESAPGAEGADAALSGGDDETDFTPRRRTRRRRRRRGRGGGDGAAAAAPMLVIQKAMLSLPMSPPWAGGSRHPSTPGSDGGGRPPSPWGTPSDPGDVIESATLRLLSHLTAMRPSGERLDASPPPPPPPPPAVGLHSAALWQQPPPHPRTAPSTPAGPTPGHAIFTSAPLFSPAAAPWDASAPPSPAPPGTRGRLSARAPPPPLLALPGSSSALGVVQCMDDAPQPPLAATRVSSPSSGQRQLSQESSFGSSTNARARSPAWHNAAEKITRRDSSLSLASLDISNLIDQFTARDCTDGAAATPEADAPPTPPPQGTGASGVITLSPADIASMEDLFAENKARADAARRENRLKASSAAAGAPAAIPRVATRAAQPASSSEPQNVSLARATAPEVRPTAASRTLPPSPTFGFSPPAFALRRPPLPPPPLDPRQQLLLPPAAAPPPGQWGFARSPWGAAPPGGAPGGPSRPSSGAGGVRMPLPPQGRPLQLSDYQHMHMHGLLMSHCRAGGDLSPTAEELHHVVAGLDPLTMHYLCLMLPLPLEQVPLPRTQEQFASFICSMTICGWVRGDDQLLDAVRTLLSAGGWEATGGAAAAAAAPPSDAPWHAPPALAAHTIGAGAARPPAAPPPPPPAPRSPAWAAPPSPAAAAAAAAFGGHDVPVPAASPSSAAAAAVPAYSLFGATGAAAFAVVSPRAPPLHGSFSPTVAAPSAPGFSPHAPAASSHPRFGDHACQ